MNENTGRAGPATRAASKLQNSCTMRALIALRRLVAAAVLALLASTAWAIILIGTLLVLMWNFLRRPLKFFSMTPSQEFRRPEVPGMESVFVQTSRIRLHALRNRSADPGRPLLLFLHGFPENAYSWRRQLLYFQDRFTVVALDMRGFGESDAPEGVEQYSVDVLALDVLAVIKACGYQSCVLIGHDWGGMVAWNFAANFPQAVDALVTVCSPHPRAYNEPACFTPGQARRSSYFLLFVTLYLPEWYLSHSGGREIRKMMLSAPMGVRNRGAVTEEDVLFYVDALLRPGRLTAGLNYYRSAMFMRSARAKRFVERTTAVTTDASDRSDATGAARDGASVEAPVGWSGPTLQLYAEDDGAFECGMFENCTIVRESWAEKCLSVVKLECCSHWAQQDQPGRVNEEIERFVNTLHLIVLA